ncbi:MAG TPA: prepilin-type N-terminal cleavage/methylation domain-containing protein [Candidatus Angelobacter sp.]|jgi:Tfp pilus assembly protein PilV|nr:prepilin-type N-terminal cleavage/methylation domain-containing protein [Candidatus Angelobacter sp.]
MSKSLRKVRRQGGFALVETLIAITILAVGLLGIAALLAQLAGNSTKSRYMSTEALLASEKLDDLNRYPINDPAIAVTNGNSAGSLTADVTDNVTVGVVTDNVDYFDQVRISAGNGNMVETVSGKDVNGNTVYTTTTHAPDGSITVATAAIPPAATSDMLTFSRRWVIELNPPNQPAGVRRFTVLVSLNLPTGASTFQATMMR